MGKPVCLNCTRGITQLQEVADICSQLQPFADKKY
jgi:hypothetical protein